MQKSQRFQPVPALYRSLSGILRECLPRVYESVDVQKAQRRAAIGTSLRHSGHFFVVGSGGASPRLKRAVSVFTGTITKKYTAAAMRRNATSALMKSPTRN